MLGWVWGAALAFLKLPEIEGGEKVEGGGSERQRSARPTRETLLLAPGGGEWAVSSVLRRELPQGRRLLSLFLPLQLRFLLATTATPVVTTTS